MSSNACDEKRKQEDQLITRCHKLDTIWFALTAPCKEQDTGSDLVKHSRKVGDNLLQALPSQPSRSSLSL